MANGSCRLAPLVVAASRINSNQKHQTERKSKAKSFLYLRDELPSLFAHLLIRGVHAPPIFVHFQIEYTHTPSHDRGPVTAIHSSHSLT